MKIPKTFNKITRLEQEKWLVEKYSEVVKELDEIKRMLATVRGGYKYEVTTEPDRPDLMTMKS